MAWIIERTRREGVAFEFGWIASGARHCRTFSSDSEARAFAADQGLSIGRRGPHALSDRLRLHSSPDPVSGCWLWTGGTGNTGYGQMTINADGKTRTALAHRVSYETFVGPIPDGLVIDHLCRVRRCVNPEHLEPVTQRENILRSPVAPGAINAAKTRCPRGHKYDREYRHKNGTTRMRCCSTCTSRRGRAAVSR